MIKFIWKFFSLIILLIISINSYASSPEYPFFTKHRPYIGLDLGTSEGGMRKNFGSKVYRESVPYAEVYTGFNFNKYLGLQLGIATLKEKDKGSTLITGDFVPGLSTAVSSAESPLSLTSNIKKHDHLYLGLTWNFISSNQNNYNLYILAGISSSKIKADHEVLNSNTRYSFSKRQEVFLTKIGFRYRVIDYVYLNFNYSWLNTYRMEITGDNNSGKIKLKDNHLFGAGIMLKAK